MTTCLYCGYEKSEEDFSQEHIIPRAIGGNLIPNNPFAIQNVCKRCNSLAGTFIDGPFIKSWITQNYRADVIMRYADINSHPILPLRYMGVIRGLQYGTKICELWLGPTGDTIYHFHEPYPEQEDVPPMVGIPTYARRNEIDHGFALLFIRSNNPDWHPTIVYSFIEHFRKSVLYLGNGSTPSGGTFVDIPDELVELHEGLRRMAGQTHELNTITGIHYGDRFLAKIALGIGSLLLGESFVTSQSADLLRRFMWTKNAEERSEIPIHGTSFFGERVGALTNIMNWPGGHLLHISQVENRLVLYASFYDIQQALITISYEPEQWSGILNEGLVYVIAPGLQKYVGPKNIGSFIAHKFEPDCPDQELSVLEAEMSQYSRLPPFDI